MNWAKIGLFAGGALFGSAGIEILTSKDAKKLYTQCTAAVLRMKDQVMKTATTLQENCGDILADAREINEQRAAEDDAVVEESLPRGRGRWPSKARSDEVRVRRSHPFTGYCGTVRPHQPPLAAASPSGEAFFIYRESNYEMEYSA